VQSDQSVATQMTSLGKPIGSRWTYARGKIKKCRQFVDSVRWTAAVGCSYQHLMSLVSWYYDSANR